MGIAVLFLVLGVVWLVQLGLTYLQARRFMARVRVLRRSGTVAIGLSGSRVRGRAYVVLAVGPVGLVRAAETLRGATVFASARPVPALVGISSAALAAKETATANATAAATRKELPARVLEAAQEAALHLHPQLRRHPEHQQKGGRRTLSAPIRLFSNWKQRSKEAGT